MTIFYFIIALSILIIVHELGHFMVARWSKIRVEGFSVGFGPKIFGFKRGDTEYKLSVLPFGGYVKMSGEEIANLDKNDKGAFYNKPIWKRSGVVLAGPVMNLFLSLFLMPIVFMIGREEPKFFYEKPQVIAVLSGSPAEKAGVEVNDLILKVGKKEPGNWKEFMDEVIISLDQDVDLVLERRGEVIQQKIHVENIPGGRGGYVGVEPIFFVGNEAAFDGVREGSPAAKAGLKPDDRILTINGAPVRYWVEMEQAVRESGGSEVQLEIQRGAEKLSVRLQPEFNEEKNGYIIGVSKEASKREIPMTLVRYGFVESLRQGGAEVYRLAALTLDVLKKLLTFELSYKTLGGPIQIAQVAAESARSGLGSFLFFLSFISLQLGVLNLLPIPVLDGGHLMFFGIEAVRRKPLGERVQGILQQIGLALILLLLVLVSINDLMNIESIKNIIDKLF